MKFETEWKDMELLFQKIQFGKDLESKFVEEGRIAEADEIAFYTDCFYPWDVVKEILDDGEGVVYNTVPPVAAKKPDYYFRNPQVELVDVGINGRKKAGEPSPYAFTSVDQDESVQKINDMLAFLKEKGYEFKEKVKATNVKQITIDIAAPANWDGETYVREVLEKQGLYVLGTNQEDLTEEYQKHGGYELLERDGTYGEFSLKEELDEFGGTIKVPGISIVNSAGDMDGTESKVQLYSSVQECMDLSYQIYAKTWDDLFQQEEVELNNGQYIDSNENPCLSKEEYETELLRDGYVLIQLDDFHIQFEYFEQELELNQEMNERKELFVNTPLGNLVVSAKTDSEYPGVYVDLKGNQVNDVFHVGEASLAMIEFEPSKETVQVVVYGDGEKEEPTHIIACENVERRNNAKASLDEKIQGTREMLSGQGQEKVQGRAMDYEK